MPMMRCASTLAPQPQKWCKRSVGNEQQSIDTVLKTHIVRGGRRSCLACTARCRIQNKGGKFQNTSVGDLSKKTDTLFSSRGSTTVANTVKAACPASLTSWTVQVGGLVRWVGFQNAARAVRKVRVASVVVLQVQGRVEVALAAQARRVCKQTKKRRKAKSAAILAEQF